MQKVNITNYIDMLKKMNGAELKLLFFFLKKPRRPIISSIENKRRIGELLGISTPTVTQTLHSLKSKGILLHKEHGVYLLNLRLLKKLLLPLFFNAQEEFSGKNVIIEEDQDKIKVIINKKTLNDE